MACVIVPIAEAVVVSLILKKMRGKGAAPARSGEGEEERGGWVRKFEWLHKALWGGAFLLVIEHVWHGEIVFWPPFLTAMSHPADTEAMLHEMATVGVCMALFITVAWFVAVLAVDRLQGRGSAATPAR
jgi:hypothetical protein